VGFVQEQYTDDGTCDAYHRRKYTYAAAPPLSVRNGTPIYGKRVIRNDGDEEESKAEDCVDSEELQNSRHGLEVFPHG
jgi:hypothetical protein